MRAQFYGGPVDGEVREVPDEREVVFAEPVVAAPMVLDDGDTFRPRTRIFRYRRVDDRLVYAGEEIR